MARLSRPVSEIGFVLIQHLVEIFEKEERYWGEGINTTRMRYIRIGGQYCTVTTIGVA